MKVFASNLHCGVAGQIRGGNCWRERSRANCVEADKPRHLWVILNKRNTRLAMPPEGFRGGLWLDGCDTTTILDTPALGWDLRLGRRLGMAVVAPWYVCAGVPLLQGSAEPHSTSAAGCGGMPEEE